MSRIRRPSITPRLGGRRPVAVRPGGRRPGSGSRRPTRPSMPIGGPGFMGGAANALAKSGKFRRPPPGIGGMLSNALSSAGGRRPIRRPGANRPGGAGMPLQKMLGMLNRVDGGMSPGPMGRPRPMGGDRRPNRPTQPVASGMMSAMSGGNPFAGGGQMFAEGGEVLKTSVDKLPNEGLKKLAKSPKGRKAVARMGFKNGGEAKGGKCPSRGTIRGTGRAVRGVGFKGVK